MGKVVEGFLFGFGFGAGVEIILILLHLIGVHSAGL